MRIVSDWRRCHRWYCMHTQAVGCVFSAVAGSLALAGAGAPWFGVFGLGIALAITAVIFATGLVGRLLDQSLDLPPPTVPKAIDKRDG